MEKEMNGFMLVKRKNNSTNLWEVAIYPLEHWIASQKYQPSKKITQKLIFRDQNYFDKQFIGVINSDD